ncbi:MAG: phosphoenolpyruvate--protein phosphotransferase [Vicinamibacterales bacterium]
MQRLTGVGVSPGIAVGRAVLLMQNPLVVRFSVSPDRVEEEVARVEEARRRSEHQLREIKERIGRTAGTELAAIFDAQLLILHDQAVTTRTIEIVREQRVNAEWALQRAFEDIVAIFDEVEDPYLRERRGDVVDVIGRLRTNLGGRRSGAAVDIFRDVEPGSVLIADDLAPSLVAQVDWHRIRAFASDSGSRTYHTAIVARSLHVPAVVGLGDASQRVPPGATVVIDGTAGVVIVDPPGSLLAEIESAIGSPRGTRTAPDPGRGLLARTADGVRVSLQANIELPEDLPGAHECGAEGIGLYRSEFLLATASTDALDEETQYAAYRFIVESMRPAPVTVRTFDVDEEQLATWPRRSGEGRFESGAANRTRGPLGLRALRLSLARPDVFRPQLRALVRAAHHGRLRVMFPFVSGVEEIRQAREHLRAAADEVSAAGHPTGPVEVGAMIEIPAAAATVDLLAAEVDFLSIGTNDLIQFALAVDRNDARVSRLYQPLHPAVLRTIRLVVHACRRAGVPVSLCGEMASDPLVLPLLIGIGLRDFSMVPSAIPPAKRVIARLSAADLEGLARRVLRMPTAAEIEHELMGSIGAILANGEKANGPRYED